MSWEIEASDEFRTWYGGLDEDEVESVNVSVDLLGELGPILGRPHVDEGRPLRILFVFDPRRVGYLI